MNPPVFRTALVALVLSAIALSAAPAAASEPEPLAVVQADSPPAPPAVDSIDFRLGNGFEGALAPVAHVSDRADRSPAPLTVMPELRFAPQPGKVLVYHRQTGERLERWPVDAKELLATGEYVTDPAQCENASAVRRNDSAGATADTSDHPDTAATASPAASHAPTDTSNPPPVSADPMAAAVDPVPHVTAAATQLEHPTGAPAVVSTAATASPAAPVQVPQSGSRRNR